MSLSIWCQVPGVRSLTSCAEIAKVFLSLQVTLAEANLGVLTISAAHHTCVMLDCRHARRRGTLRGNIALRTVWLVSRWQLTAVITSWGESIRSVKVIVLIVLNGAVSMHSWLLLKVVILSAAIYNHTFPRRSEILI